MGNLKTINYEDIPKNFTGIAKYPNGTKLWFKDGEFHREDGPAIIFQGREEWYKNGLLHREDGPAIEYNNGTKVWYKNGKVHREDGPAIVYPDGTKYWHLNDIKLTKEQHELLMMFSEYSRQKLYKNNNRGLKNLLGI